MKSSPIVERWGPLILIPAFYWSFDMFLHGLAPHFHGWRWLGILAFGLPTVVAAIAWWWTWKVGNVAGGALGGAGAVLLGIHLLGPTYMIGSRLVEHLGGVPLNDSVIDFVGTAAMLTMMFPMTTFSLSAYDATLLSPFIAFFLVALAIRLGQGDSRDWRGWYSSGKKSK